MTTPEIKEGVAVYYPDTGPAHDGRRSHIFIFITNENASGDILMLPVCSHLAGCDETCVIVPSDGWDKISRKSYIAYHHTKKVYVKNVQKHMNSARVTYIGLVPNAIYIRVKAGVEVSDEMEPQYLQYFKLSQTAAKA